MANQVSLVKNVLIKKQNEICHALEAVALKSFKEDMWEFNGGEGGGSTRILESDIIEKAGVNFSHIKGLSLPQAATKERPYLMGKPFEVLGLSIVIHPKNPYVPTVHGNVRYFEINHSNQLIWWIGGGVDMTPYYGNDEDCIQWHQWLKQICDRQDSNIYSQFKKQCDDYFYLKHRSEARGIGGIFFDDLNAWGFDRCFEFIQDVVQSIVQVYVPILNKRKDTSYGKKEREFQLVRRGRYVEFNLLYDRGTLFGLQSGGRTESILMSLPPQVEWKYDYLVEPNTPEAKLYEWYLQPKNWHELN